jgi:hypothetical protein
MGEAICVGRVSCPSGYLVVLDGGYLGMWSGDRSPSDLDPAGLGIEDEALAANMVGSKDFHGSGPIPYHYDIPGDAVEEWTQSFAERSRERGLDGQLEAYPRMVPHRERALRAARERLPGFTFFGVPAVAVGPLPTDRGFDVVAERTEGEWDGWRHMTVQVSDAPAASTAKVGEVGVDWARIAFADVDALSRWEHDRPLDGLADVLLWGGPDAEEAAAHFELSPVDTPGDDGSYGWTDLPVEEAARRAMRIQAWKDEVPGRKFGLDFRPHSHHWKVMARVRASRTESGTVTVGGAEILFAMTSWGDGFFPVEADYDAAGSLVAVRVNLVDQ